MSGKKSGCASSRKMRADCRLFELNLAESRAQAAALILAGEVFLGEQRVHKPGTAVAPDAPLRVRLRHPFVSRGGQKLDGALERLDLSPAGLTCVDVGASTGGFTDCLLQRGASRVYAVDVGQGLLANRLARDPRVIVMDRTNARHLALEQFDAPLELAVVDASFIGIAKLLPALAAILRPGALLVAMIKPQFEVGRDEARRAKGVIRDPVLRARVIEAAQISVGEAGFDLLDGCDSPLPGPKGNVEYFIAGRRRPDAPLTQAGHKASTQTS